MTSWTSLSAPLVFTWKKLGAERRMTLPQISSLQLPAPVRRSTPETLRALGVPLVMTRTMEVAPTPSSTRFAWPRGKAPVGVQMATSVSPVRLEWRMPTRSISSSWLPAR